jgi:hypothetical protein
MIRTAKEILQPGERALVVFTRGPHFQHDASGKGVSGNWRVSDLRLSSINRIIIYLRNENLSESRIFIGDYKGWESSPEPQRKIIKFSNLKEVCRTTANWVEFSGRSRSPTAYINA